MLKISKLSTHVSKKLQSLFKTHYFAIYLGGVSSRNFSDDGHGVFLNDNNGLSESETEWERLLKPFDLKELRKSLNQISPYQLCKLLELPLDVPTSMEIFEWAGAQKGYCHSFDVYYVLIDKLGAAGEFKVIDRLLMQMKEEGIVFKETLFLMIMKCYGRASLPGQATRLLLDMRGIYSCEPTFRSYNVVLDILVAGNCPKVAPNVFYDMLSKGVSPTAYTFGVVMKAVCMVGEVDSACSLLRDMTKHGCVPNSVVYQTLIHALSKNNRVNEALKLLDEMFLMGCTPDVQTFNDVIHGLCKLNRIHEAAKLVDRMLHRGFSPDNITYGVLMHGLCRMGKVDDARALLNKVPAPNVVLFSTLINGYVTSGRFYEAKDVMYNCMLSIGCAPDVFTFNMLIHGLCKKGSLTSACRLVNEMAIRGCEPNVVTYTTLIDGFCKAGQLEEASDVLNEMSAKGLSLNTVGYNCLICALCKDEKVNEALEMLGEMSRKGCKPDIFTFNSLIFGLCKSNKIDEALGVYRDMLLEGVIANTVTYNTLIHAFLRRGEIQEAFKLVNDMLFRGCPLDIITYNGLIKALCKAGAVEKGLALFEEMMRKGLNINNISCNILINGLCRVGKVHNALEFLRDMIHRGLMPDIVTYNTLINGLCKMRRLQEAWNLFDRLQLEGICPDAITYNTLICWHCKEDMRDNAYLILHKGVENGFIPNNVTWYLLVSNFVKESAKEILRWLRQKVSQHNVYFKEETIISKLEPRYIQLLKEKTKEREKYREVVYERKIAKERSQDDHLYADKDKFVTSAYKKKLEEQKKWMEEEHLLELQEAQDDVTKKSDLSDFYFNIGKNVAFGAKDAEVRRSEKQVEPKKPVKLAESRELEKLELKGSDDTSDEGQSPNASNAPLKVSVMEDKHQGESSILPKKSVESFKKKPITNTSDQEKTSAEQPKRDHHKRSGDAVAAAKEQFLERKKAKEQ